MDKMKSQHADLVQVMTSFGKDIDDKMKDIRSLLLGKGNKDTDSTLFIKLPPLATRHSWLKNPVKQRFGSGSAWIRIISESCIRIRVTLENGIRTA